MEDKETLLGISSVYLFGRQLSDLQLMTNYGTTVPKRGRNNFLRNQLEEGEPRLARIYAFTFESTFDELARPAIFLVHGSGVNPDDPAPTNAEGEVEYDRLARSPGSTARTGLGSHTGALAKDLRVWIYDKGDFSMRLEAETGTFEQILLGAEILPQGAASGVMARSSGGLARSSGVMARSSGWMPRRSGDGD